MYDTLHDKINRSLQTLKQVKTEIEQLPTIQDLSTVMDVLECWEHRYKEWCDEVDEEEGIEVGKSYNDSYGHSIEYYVEAHEMHALSLAFRNLKNILDNKQP